MSFVVVSYFTKDKIYLKYAGSFAASAEKFGLNYDLEVIENKGSWQANTSYKSEFIQKMLKKHFPSSIVYVDIDAIFCQYPILFDSLKCDIAVHVLDHKLYRPTRHNLEVLSGTIFLSNNERVVSLVNIWLCECRKSPQEWDQRVLARVLDHDFFNLPAEYCCIFDYMGKVVINPVIKHFQASRESRRLRIEKKEV